MTKNNAKNTNNGTTTEALFTREQVLSMVATATKEVLDENNKKWNARLDAMEAKYRDLVNSKTTNEEMSEVKEETTVVTEEQAKEAHADEIKQLEEKDGFLKRRMQEILAEINTAAGQAKIDLMNELKEVTETRKVTQNSIRKLTANGIRVVANVQHVGVDAAVDLVANAVKGVNHMIVNGLNWTADKIDVKTAAAPIEGGQDIVDLTPAQIAHLRKVLHLA
ncbi:hypothetical protein ACK8P5_25880 (plasmid) [Paenibacillus sp. EC2-1]|uniref:hypothetical protein n=1 Tax=Paenibacillus sp. EC2-1 TaxID=3388665 RepID=UPI003BEEE66B